MISVVLYLMMLLRQMTFIRYSDYASSTEIMYRTYFKPHSANKGTYYYTSCEDTFIPFQITLPE